MPAERIFSQVRYAGRPYDIEPQENKKRLQRWCFSSDGNYIAVPKPARVPPLLVNISPYLPQRRALSVVGFTEVLGVLGLGQESLLLWGFLLIWGFFPGHPGSRKTFHFLHIRVTFL